MLISRFAQLVLLLGPLSLGFAAERNPNTDWFANARYGAFMHFLPADAKQLALVEKFDVSALAEQLQDAGVGYLVLTLGQNSGFYNSPNAVYDRVTGYSAGERCAKRDLPLDLSRVLQRQKIRLLLYLPCQVPNGDARAQKAFGLRQGQQDQPIDPVFAAKWAEVIQHWADRYGERVSGWWFDGGYEHIGFNETIAQTYAKAAKHGNPNAIVTFNPGVKVVRWTQAEDYTAGELNDPFGQVPSNRWLDGSQWHALTFVGSSWGKRDVRHADADWAKWVLAVTVKGGTVTLDVGPNYSLDEGPIGSVATAQLRQLKAIRSAVRGQ